MDERKKIIEILEAAEMALDDSTHQSSWVPLKVAIVNMIEQLRKAPDGELAQARKKIKALVNLLKLFPGHSSEYAWNLWIENKNRLLKEIEGELP